MNLADFASALEDYFGPDSEIQWPEGETEAWRSVVEDYRRGAYRNLLREFDQLLARPDGEIVSFLESHAPAWSFESAADARRAVEVFYSYVQTYST
jgi:hypothetical protein